MTPHEVLQLGIIVEAVVILLLLWRCKELHAEAHAARAEARFWGHQWSAALEIASEERDAALAATAREEELTNQTVGEEWTPMVRGWKRFRCGHCNNIFRPGELADGLCDWCREPTSLPPEHAATMTGKPGQYDAAGCCYNPPEGDA